jgi:hypothetical protein
MPESTLIPFIDHMGEYGASGFATGPWCPHSHYPTASGSRIDQFTGAVATARFLRVTM